MFCADLIILDLEFLSDIINESFKLFFSKKLLNIFVFLISCKKSSTTNKEFTLEILSDKIHHYHAAISAKEARSLLEKEIKEWEVKKNISEVDFWVSYLPELVKYFSRQPASKVKGWIKDK